jgi:hypothetical protein
LFLFMIRHANRPESLTVRTRVQPVTGIPVGESVLHVPPLLGGFDSPNSLRNAAAVTHLPSR